MRRWNGGGNWEGIKRRNLPQNYLPANISIKVLILYKVKCKMLFLALAPILTLVSLPTPSASQGDNTTLPLTLPARVISTN